MFNKGLKIAIPFLTWMIIGLYFTLLSFAGESTSIKIGCLIPEIPGVNVAIVEEGLDLSEQEKIQLQQQTTDAPSLFQKDEEIVRIVDGEKTLLQVKTFYSR